DGGSYPELYEVGTDLSLLPISRDPSLVGYWKFDEGTGGTAYDASGHGNTGTLTNNPTWQTSASCVKGGCLSFDSSSNNYSNMGTSTSLNLQDSFSIVFWTYARSETAINPRIFAKYIDANNNYRVYSKGINATSFGARFIRNGVSYDNQANLPSFQWNTWYHVAVVFNGGLSFYINGSSVSNYAGIAPSIGADTNLYIAKSESGYFNGVVDNARIYNRALSAAEVAAIYNSGN
ncbi:MAG: LamG domain-containing protein, partial [Minisyncoccia bacterium]